MTNRIKVSTALLAVIAIISVMAVKAQTMLFAANNGGAPTTLEKNVRGMVTLSPEAKVAMSHRNQKYEPSVTASASPIQQKNDSPQIEALGSSKCEANYFLDNAGTIFTGWKDLGTVSFPGKRKKCQDLAKQYAHYAKEKLLQYAPVGSPNFFAICDASKLCVGFNIKVGGDTYSKDGNACTPVACTKPNCPWNGYK